MGSKGKRAKKNNKSHKMLIISVIIILLVAVVAGIYYYTSKSANNKNENILVDLGVDEGLKPEEEKTESIFEGNSRPVAVMIDNHKGAWHK